MTIKEAEVESPIEPKLTVEFLPAIHGRSAKVFHITDTSFTEITLTQKEAVRVAKSILRITKEQK